MQLIQLLYNVNKTSRKQNTLAEVVIKVRTWWESTISTIFNRSFLYWRRRRSITSA